LGLHCTGALKDALLLLHTVQVANKPERDISLRIVCWFADGQVPKTRSLFANTQIIGGGSFDNVEICRLLINDKISTLF
jgi:hypothetical protein